MKSYYQFLTLSFIILLLGACKEPVQDVVIYEVKNSFNVGDNAFVRSLAVEPKKQSLWVGTSMGVHQVDYISGDLKSTFTREHGLANEYVFAITVDKDGYKWFGTNAGGMSRYKDGEWKTFFPLHGLADYWVYAFANHPDGSLWVGTWAGVNHVNRQTLEFKTYVKELINEWVYGIDIEENGTIWFGTEGGVTRFDGQHWQSWNHDDGLGIANENGLPFSKNTGLGTRSRHDLGILAGGKATYNPSYVFSIKIDSRDNAVWAGTWGAGVGRFQQGKWSNLSVKDGLAGNIVYSIMQASDGAMWFGTNGGVSRYDGINWQTFNVRNGLLNNDVYSIVESPDGAVWVGTRSGVSQLTPLMIKQ
ncbi:two-component regulator propeller domain-containing protein [Thalassotalea sp. G2M2-11]|uniref:ligand-binding sensor domain-containing protein n=1 Tax=Thalassotalea sp. G2M2-11 TaxID=2787627 RepID=UPI0019D1E805|nr:two-component regulator propeller domain-containing protein [Thalassotalea sp. G2M2-11]